MLGIKRKNAFFDLLTQQTDFVVSSAVQFQAMLADFGNANNYVQEIKAIEHAADQVRHELGTKIDEAFVTPMDKEDLSALADRLDDIVDCVESASTRISIYKVQSLRPDLAPMAANLVAMTKKLQTTVVALGEGSKLNDIKDMFVQLHSIENDTDQMFRAALGTLFETMQDQPVQIIIWKELYDRIERAVDKCEDASNVVESMVVKYA
ncbi:MAG: DUF47 domain-containing protein [Armatimonadetes bacterium]|nr:DUF47 domain-containing protein [Armatimonadota bacterium]